MRRILSPLLLLFAFASPLMAQAAPYMADFEFVSSNGYDQYFGQYSSGGVFQVFCVDPQHFVSPGDEFGVWVTRMDATDQTHLRNVSGGAWASYYEAARIASFLFSPSGFTSSQVNSAQLAIWWAMGYRDPNYAYTQGTTELNYAMWSNAAASVVLYPSQWVVISSKSGNKQEFIAPLPSRPQETVPEPATLLLLGTGLAALRGVRRRG